jgi:nitroreductase
MPVESAYQLIHARQTVMPKRLAAPGPDDEQLDQILRAAAAAPDHGQITPWRLIIVADSARSRLADVFVQALQARDGAATAEELSRAAEKAHRAPLLMLAVGKSQTADSAINDTERLVSAGCAIQNMLLMATAMGFGSALTTGKALVSPLMAQLFELQAGEIALCFISIGTAKTNKTRTGRPVPVSFVSTLT